MLKWIKRIDKLLLPPSEENRLAPFVWLVYLSIFYFGLGFLSQENNKWFFGIGATAVFLPLYFHAYWQCGFRVSLNIFAMALLGSYFATVTSGASVFFVYAGAFCARLGNPRRGSLGLLLLCIWIGAISWVLGLTPYFYVPSIMFTLMIGGVNIYQAEIEKKRRELALSREEVKALARTAERERIARDLHDLIGHTFSIITLKAELAGKLIDSDIDRAKQEVKQLEEISRDALKQVREVVTGFRTTDLTTELAHAKYVFESNDIHFEYQFTDGASGQEMLDATSSEKAEMELLISKELAVILKELVTNILKHAKASQVSAKIYLDKKHWIMELVDNGVGFQSKRGDGFGLQGISERLSKLSGTITIDSSVGTKITISVPQKGGI